MNAPENVALKFGSGQAVNRIEDPALVQGLGGFTDDHAPLGQVFLAFARSPYAHADIVSIDTEAARAVPGVLAIYTGAELAAAGVKPIPVAPAFRRADGTPMATPPRHALAVGRVRFAGEQVVAVVAESRAAARAGADAVMVDYEALPAVVDPLAAIKAGAPQLCPEAPDNISAEMRHGDAAATEAAFAKAAHRVSLDIVNQRLAPSPMEPRSVLAAFDAASGRLTVRLSSQMPTAVRSGLADAIPGARSVTVPGCDHFSLITHGLLKASAFDFLDGWLE